MPTALVFDLDDTLFPEREFVQGGFAAVDRWLQGDHAVFGFEPEARRLFAEGLRGRIFDEALRRLGVDGAQTLVPRMVAVYRGHRPQLELFPDAQWALGHFRGRCKLGLITDGYAGTQRNKVAALGLGEGFEAIVFTDDLGRENWKPSPIPFQGLMETLGCPGSACVYVGDNPAKDFLAPNRLGWRTIQVAREEGEYRHTATDSLPADYQASRVIQSLRELEGVFDE